MPDAHAVNAWPLVVLADRETTITLQPADGGANGAWSWRPDVPYRVTYWPVEEWAQRSGWPADAERPVRAEDGLLPIRWYFEGEQEHVLHIQEASPDGSHTPVVKVRIYSVLPDLFSRYPFKVDLHLHSNRSDGREPPAYVAAAGRRIGLDALAVTDHGRYAPSIEAQQAYADLELDLTILPGEEVHPPDNPVHMINFGGDHSVNALFASQAYREQVAALMAASGPLPPGVDAYQYASCCWTLDEIRRGGGLAIFCHPYWFTQNRYSPSGALTSLILERCPFDAFELIGGYWLDEAESNQLQVARYHEERAAGRTIPIVGASDAHGCERGLFGWYYSLVFAPSTQGAALRESVLDLYSVAIEALPGESVRAHGPFRMVKYALFLCKHVLPQHDALCQPEGYLMMRHICGDTSAAGALAALRGQVGALYRQLWAH
jgi:hypothetical protein